MKDIKLKSWLIAAATLIALGLIVDYYFIHILFSQKLEQQKQTPDSSLQEAITSAETSADGNIAPPPTSKTDSSNFLETLKNCAPEISAQAIATPEALMEYLLKSVGTLKQETDFENFHIKLPDGSERRIHVIGDDNTNSPNKKEVRFFKLDAEGFPLRLPLKDESLDDLLKLGELTRKEKKSSWILKDNSHLSLETHDDQIYEFQLRGPKKTLSCYLESCHCK